MSRDGLWLELFKAALAGSAVAAAETVDRPTVSPKGIAAAASRVASEAEEVVMVRRGVEAPVERLLRAVDGVGLYSDYPPDLKARLHTVYEAAAAVKAARSS